MWQPNNRQWWVLVITALFIVCAWPPRDDKSLAMKFVNWAVDPRGELPVMPPPFTFANGDDPQTVTEHDTQSLNYGLLYLKGGWIRRRLELKVADDPVNPSTERQLLIALGVATVFLVWRFERKSGRVPGP
jgi:hypothetical protein